VTEQVVRLCDKDRALLRQLDARLLSINASLESLRIFGIKTSPGYAVHIDPAITAEAVAKTLDAKLGDIFESAAVQVAVTAPDPPDDVA
jgi:hypothetical protein